MDAILNRIFGPVRQWLARHTADADLWQKGVPSELAFWKNWVRSKGDRWPQDYEFRMDPQAPLQEHVALWLPRGARTARILDVGAGPATSLLRIT